jgi:hypothetical protein
LSSQATDPRRRAANSSANGDGAKPAVASDAAQPKSKAKPKGGPAAGRRERPGHRQMSQLGRILASDGMIGFMLLVVVVEATVLMFWHGSTGNGPDPMLLMSFLGAGASLMSAMFFVKRIEKTALPFATALLSALFFHIWHVVLLWPR